ncbi:MAG TPA: hypothetical protein VIV10_02650 [Gemmatimonadales bacterium]
MALEAWLAGLRLSVQARLLLDVVVSDQEPEPLGQALFEQPEMRFGLGPQGRGLRVVWDHATALAELPAGATMASVRLSPGAVARLDRCTRTFLLAVVILLLRRVGWYHLHAATAIDPGGQGWLFTGNAHVGKSTTAALLATSGWQIGTDDAAFLERVADRILVHTAHAPIALREGGRRLLAKAGGIVLPDRGKVGFWPEDLGAVWTPLVSPDIVIFPTVGRTRTTAQPIARAEAIAELVRWSAWVMLESDLAQAHLDVLTQLAGQARCYRVTLGRDLFARPNRLIELVT